MVNRRLRSLAGLVLGLAFVAGPVTGAPTAPATSSLESDDDTLLVVRDDDRQGPGATHPGDGKGHARRNADGPQGEGAEKQEELRQRKMEQEQKELGKGSEQGQESREKRRKWWRFWE